jgi:hypothetical protein
MARGARLTLPKLRALQREKDTPVQRLLDDTLA